MGMKVNVNVNVHAHMHRMLLRRKSENRRHHARMLGCWDSTDSVYNTEITQAFIYVTEDIGVR